MTLESRYECGLADMTDGANDNFTLTNEMGSESESESDANNTNIRCGSSNHGWYSTIVESCSGHTNAHTELLTEHALFIYYDMLYYVL